MLQQVVLLDELHFTGMSCDAENTAWLPGWGCPPSALVRRGQVNVVFRSSYLRGGNGLYMV